MPAEDRRQLPSNPDDANKIRMVAATAAVNNNLMDYNGNGSRTMEARVGGNGQSLYLTADPNSPVASTAQINIANAQSQSNANVQANFNAAVLASQQQSVPVATVQPAVVATRVEETTQPGTAQRI